MDVGPILKRHGLLDLKAVTEKLERRVVEHFNELLREFRFALNSHDFLAKASRRVVVMAYCKKSEGDGAGVKLMCVCERNVTESDRAFEKPATLIQNLLTDARSDASEIIATLDKMQLAMGRPAPAARTELLRSDPRLCAKLLQCHEEVQASVRNLHNHSLTIEVYRCLSKAMEQGLRQHFPNLTLNSRFGVSENLEQMLRNDLKSNEGIVSALV